MDDDLSVPAALAVLQGVIREGNKLLADGQHRRAAPACWPSVRAMLDVLGLDPLSPTWDRARRRRGARARWSTPWSRGLLEQRQQARAARTSPRRTAIRDQLAAAGIEIEDTPQGPRWSVKGDS